MKVFISYRRKNGGKALAYLINRELNRVGIETFFDIDDMSGARDFSDKIKAEVHDSDCLLLLLQSDMFSDKKKSGTDYVVEEIITAMKSGVEIFTVTSDDINSFQWEKEKRIPPELKPIKLIDMLSFTIKGKNAFIPAFLTAAKMRKVIDEQKFAYYSLMNGLIDGDNATRSYNNVKNIIYKTEPGERWRGAKRISVLAIAGGTIMGVYNSTIKNASDGNTKFRFITCDCEGDACEDIELNKQCSIVNTRGTVKTQYNANLMYLAEICGKNAGNQPENLDYRLTDAHLTCTIQIIEYENSDDDFVIVEYLPTVNIKERSQADMPAALIRRGDQLFGVYKKQFEILWDAAKKVKIID